MKTREDNYIDEDEDSDEEAAKYVFNNIKIEMNLYAKGDKGTDFILSFRKLNGDYFIYNQFLKSISLRMLLP